MTQPQTIFAVGVVISLVMSIWNPWTLILIASSYTRMAFLKIAKSQSTLINIIYMLLIIAIIGLSPASLAVLTHNILYLAMTGISFTFILKDAILAIRKPKTI